jgi:sterol 3beta-glucosyltransferase
VERIGAGPKPIPQKQYNAEMLAAAISQAVTDKTMVRRAAEIGKKLCTEDGVANAIQFIERVTSS